MKKCFIFLVLWGGALCAWAQSGADLFNQAEALRLGYRFEEAAAVFSKIIKQAQDSVLTQKAVRQLLFCENGQVLLSYIETPTATGKAAVPETNFFNYYDFNFGGNWAFTPAVLLKNTPPTDTIFPVFVASDNANALYFSSRADGNWNIYVIRHAGGSTWTAPEPLANINTPFDERFPYVTPDGKTLYFSSNGHSGMGGFDLYKSAFDEATQQWSAPENLGFPYSSPYDDWLFVPSVDQTMAVFASSREQKKDSLTLYRITLEANPIKQSGRTVEDIQQLAKLQPAGSKKPAEQPTSITLSPEEKEYQALYQKLNEQKQGEQKIQRELASSRKLYATLDDPDERLALRNKIETSETQALNLQADMRQTEKQIRQAEQKLLENGIIPEAPAIAAKSASTPEQQATSFAPNYKPSTVLPAMTILAAPENAESADNYLFRIVKEPVVFYNPPLAEGLIYRIQIGRLSRKFSSAEFKGLAPAFIQAEGNLYTHYIGQFTTYDDANKALPEVKKRFRETIVVAFLNGKKISIKEAREYEQKNKNATIYNVVLGEYPDGLPQALRVAVQENSNRDIVKTQSKGRTVYIVGPFASSGDAQKLQEQLRAKGFEVTVE